MRTNWSIWASLVSSAEGDHPIKMVAARSHPKSRVSVLALSREVGRGWRMRRCITRSSFRIWTSMSWSRALGQQALIMTMLRCLRLLMLTNRLCLTSLTAFLPMATARTVLVPWPIKEESQPDPIALTRKSMCRLLCSTRRWCQLSSWRVKDNKHLRRLLLTIAISRVI